MGDVPDVIEISSDEEVVEVDAVRPLCQCNNSAERPQESDIVVIESSDEQSDSEIIRIYGSSSASDASSDGWTTEFLWTTDDERSSGHSSYDEAMRMPTPPFVFEDGPAPNEHVRLAGMVLMAIYESEIWTCRRRRPSVDTLAQRIGLKNLLALLVSMKSSCGLRGFNRQWIDYDLAVDARMELELCSLADGSFKFGY